MHEPSDLTYCEGRSLQVAQVLEPIRSTLAGREVPPVLRGYLRLLRRLAPEALKNASMSRRPTTADVQVREPISEDQCTFELNGVKFLMTFDSQMLHRKCSTENCFLLGKAGPMVERFREFDRRRRIHKVFELGILQGGSVVLFDELFHPEKLVAIELARPPVEALASYIAKHAKSDVVKPYYGVNQADQDTMGAILSSEFPERDIDLVVDDASHFYKETRASFNIVFPYLIAGGLYVIEDWGWAHWSGEPWQGPDSPFGESAAMTNLLVELAMFAASCPGMIKDIRVDHEMIVVERGRAALPAGRFDIGEHYRLRGKKFKAWI